MQFTIVAPPSVMRSLEQQRELRTRAANLELRAAIAIEELDKVLNRGVSCPACTFGGFNGRCASCTYEAGEPIVREPTIGRQRRSSGLENTASPMTWTGRGSGKYTCTPDGKLGEIEYFTGTNNILSVT